MRIAFVYTEKLPVGIHHQGAVQLAAVARGLRRIGVGGAARGHGGPLDESSGAGLGRCFPAAPRERGGCMAVWNARCGDGRSGHGFSIVLGRNRGVSVYRLRGGVPPWKECVVCLCRSEVPSMKKFVFISGTMRPAS